MTRTGNALTGTGTLWSQQIELRAGQRRQQVTEERVCCLLTKIQQGHIVATLRPEAFHHHKRRCPVLAESGMAAIEIYWPNAVIFGQAREAALAEVVAPISTSLGYPRAVFEHMPEKTHLWPRRKDCRQLTTVSARHARWPPALRAGSRLPQVAAFTSIFFSAGLVPGFFGKSTVSTPLLTSAAILSRSTSAGRVKERSNAP